jgi:hypothetical protein
MNRACFDAWNVSFTKWNDVASNAWKLHAALKVRALAGELATGDGQVVKTKEQRHEQGRSTAE